MRCSSRSCGIRPSTAPPYGSSRCRPKLAREQSAETLLPAHVVCALRGRRPRRRFQRRARGDRGDSSRMLRETPPLRTTGAFYIGWGCRAHSRTGAGSRAVILGEDDMAVRNCLRYVGIVVASLILFPLCAVAQNTGIAGVVRDTSGAVLPGATVEASSPALIEKVRSATADAQGLYQIVDLRPGLYTVTFTLPGFTTVKREGIELTGSFTATVNAEMRVGAVEETITVSGSAPTVDVHNVVDQKVLTDELREDLPTARNVHNMAQLLPGTVMNSGTGRPSSQDVGGLSGDRGVVMIHGSRAQDFIISIDGSMLNYGTATSQAQALNPAEGQEYVYETAALSAESQSGGVRANVIPKEGGNRFTGFFLGSYAGSGLQSDNLNDELRNRGLNSVNRLKYIYDANVAAGGPIKKDRLWFFSSFRRWAEQETVAGGVPPLDAPP